MPDDASPTTLPPAATTLERVPDVDVRAAYLDGVRAAPTTVLRPFLTPRCPECGQYPTPDRDDPDHPHVFEVRDRAAYIAIGCEGYFTVDPAVVGLDRGQWALYR